MLKKALQLSVVLFFIGSSSFAQWSGTATETITSGNVGIGTTNPSTKLEINLFNPNSTPQYGLLLKTNSFFTWANAENSYFLKAEEAGNPNATFVLNGKGFLGMGNATPIYPLTLESPETVMASFKHNGIDNSWIKVGSNNGYMNLGVGATTTHPYIWSGTNSFFIGNDGSPTVFVNGMNNGSVGIGTSTPEAKFHVDITRESSSIPQAGLLIKTSSFYTNDNAANSYYLKTLDAGNQTTAFIVKGNGSVGIGTDNPGNYKLAVEGSIAARSVKVTSSAFADYVFEPTYKLRPLSSVESYINENKHLPGMPSAKEVEKDGGFELGNMNVKLLEKVEELTLYILELNKKLAAQQKEIEQLKKSSK